MSQLTKSSDNPLRLDLAIDLSGFIQQIKTNFITIWTKINDQQKQIQGIKEFNERKERQHQGKQNKQYNPSMKSQQNVSLNYSQLSENDKSRKQIDEGPKGMSGLKTSQSKQKLEYEGVQNPEIQPEEADRNSGGQKERLEGIESKVKQLNQRLSNLQFTSVKQIGNLNKKMSSLTNDLNRNDEQIIGKTGQIKKIELQIEKLRSQLSEYKLKKQSQLMKLSNTFSSTNSSNNNNSYNEYIFEKIQEVSSYLPMLVLKEEIEEVKAELGRKILRNERNIEEKVGLEQFNGFVNILSQNNQNKDQTIISPSNQVPQNHTLMSYKMLQLQSLIKQLKQQIFTLKSSYQEEQNKNLSKIHRVSQKIQIIANHQLQIKQKSALQQQFMRMMNQSYNQKFREIISQMAETQESFEKFKNQLKFYNQGNQRAQTNLGSTPNSSSSIIQPSKIADVQVEVGNLKKKMNKLTLKLQSIKEDILTVRQDYSRDFDVTRANIEKKCDWESLKKALNYFEDKVKEVFTSFQMMRIKMSQPEDNESTAAKRGWTCLCCDKNIKQYEGKLGQVKFTNIFPTRYESPRIGGYFKQKEGSKQYSQIFLKQSRRLSQNNTKSKDQI